MVFGLGWCFTFFLCLAASPSPGLADAVGDFRSLPDNRIAVRTSLGMRRAEAISDSQVQVVLGMSVTKAAARAECYRVISFQDENYAYAKFVTPIKAAARTEPDAGAPPGCLFPRFERTIVTLDLPTRMEEGIEYFVVAQGSQGEMVTGAHTAQGFVFRKGATRPAADYAVDMAVLGLRQVEPVGPRLVRLEFGPNFAPEAGSQPTNYRVRMAGRPTGIKRLGRITRLDTYLPVGWPYSAIPMHEVFLEFETAFKEGDSIEVEVGRAVTSAANQASIRFSEKTSLSNSIKVNQVGYLTDSPIKVAYLGRWMGSFPGAALMLPKPPEFRVCRESDGAVVFQAAATLIHRSGEMNEGHFKVDHSGENVYLLDFTPWKTPGRYFISVPEIGRSLSFEIEADAYRKAFEVQAYGVFAQRCGIELGPPYSEWRRIACHAKGLTLTSQVRTEPHDIKKDLPPKVVYGAIASKDDPALERLNRDPALVAHYRLDGDFKDATGHGHDLTPVAPGQRFTTDRQILPKANQVFGPTQPGKTNGATARGIPADAKNGYTICGWFKKDDNNDFHGTLFGFGTGEWGKPRMHVNVGWGVLAISVGGTGRPTQHARINDNQWHHVALVLPPATGKPRQASLYVDGRVACSAEAAAGTDGEFFLGTINGSGAGKAFFDDFRLYSRTLSVEEIGVLALPRPSETPVVIAAHGGHHDAGDYNPRSHLDVAQTLMDVYEMAPGKFYDGQLNIPERGNGVPDILDEAFWALRLWVGLQDEEGGVCNGTESAGDPNFVETVELDRVGDYAYARDAAGSYAFAGAMAQAARIWKSLGEMPKAENCLARARRAYEWAEQHRPKETTPRQFSVQYRDPKAYAAAQLLRTTGEERFNRNFLEVSVWSKNPDAEIDVYNQYDQSLAAWAYVNCPAKAVDREVQEAVRRAILARAEMFIQSCQTMAYVFIRHPMAPINWGTGAYENNLPVVMWSYKLTGDEKYRYWMVRTCDNTLGANPLNRSYIVGLGTRTVRAPLHNSRYSHLGEVVAGQHVEGPVQSGDGYRVAETAFPPIRKDFAILHTFVDAHFAIDMDEGLVTAQAKSMAAFGLLLPERPKEPSK